MAFGFPAYHEMELSSVPAGINIGLSLMATLGELGRGPSFDANGIIASTGANQKGLGEKIIVTLSDFSPTKIRSECMLATQCMDFGKNQKNVERILQELPKHYMSG